MKKYLLVVGNERFMEIDESRPIQLEDNVKLLTNYSIKIENGELIAKGDCYKIE